MNHLSQQQCCRLQFQTRLLVAVEMANMQNQQKAIYYGYGKAHGIARIAKVILIVSQIYYKSLVIRMEGIHRKMKKTVLKHARVWKCWPAIALVEGAVSFSKDSLFNK